jgi:hypothetical protein
MTGVEALRKPSESTERREACLRPYLLHRIARLCKAAGGRLPRALPLTAIHPIADKVYTRKLGGVEAAQSLGLRVRVGDADGDAEPGAAMSRSLGEGVNQFADHVHLWSGPELFDGFLFSLFGL